MAKRLLLVLLSVLVLATPAAGEDVYEQKSSVDAQISELRDKISSARAKEEALSAEIDVLTTRIRGLEQDVGDVTAQVEALERDLSLHQQRLERISELLRLQTQRLNFLGRQWRAANERLENRLVEIYKVGEPTAIEVVLSSSSFTELLDQLDYVRAIGSQDKRIASEVAGARREVAAARRRTSKTRASVAAATRVVQFRTSQVRAVRDELVSTQHSLEGARDEERETLSDVQHTKEEYLEEVEALAAVSAELTAKIRAAQAQAAPAASASSPSSASRTPSAAGFVWPCSGGVTSPFGWRWGRMHEGIDLGCGYGAPVAAAAGGTVIVAGWMGGYGNLVVIDHGGGIATAYGHNSSLSVGSGQSVGQGQVIAAIGSTGHSTGPHLHFEVRVGGAPVDPLGYL